MNGYSKMRSPSNKKTRSMDFSDLPSSSSSFCPPQTQETTGLQSPESNNKGSSFTESSVVAVELVKCVYQTQRRDSSPTVLAATAEEEGDATPADYVGPVKLTRTCSVAPANYNYSSPRFQTILDRQRSSRRTRPSHPSSTSIQSAVKRVFSMRRSSSVSEKYCRIYYDDDDEDAETAAAAANANANADENNINIARKTRSMKPDKKNGILKACKRLLGF